MAEVNNISRSFADNVNYLAELDKQYYKNGFIKRNGIQLSTTEYFGSSSFNYFDREQKQHINTVIHSGSIVGNAGLEQFLIDTMESISSLHTDIEYSIAVTDSNGVIPDKNIEIIFSSTNTIIGLLQIDISMFISPGVVANYTKYSILSESNNYIAVLPYLATLDDSFNNSILSLSDIAEDIVTVANNVDNVAIVGNNIDSVNTVANGIYNVEVLVDNIDSINTVSDASNLADIIRVADDLNSLDVNGIADITIVANDLVKQNSDIIAVSSNIDNVVIVGDNINDVNNVSSSIANVNTVGDNITNVNIVSSNIGDVNSVSDIADEVVIVANNINSIVIDSDNIESINLLASDLSNAGLDNVYDAGNIIDDIDSGGAGTSLIETVADNIVNVNKVGIDIDNVNAVGSNINNVNEVASTIIPVIAEVLEADTNAAIATAKAAEASNSETMAHKWATEPEDVPVVGTVGVDDEYSAYHWAKKAEQAVGGNITLNSLYDVDTTGMPIGGMIRFDGTNYVSYDFTRNPKLGLSLTSGSVVSEGEIAWNSIDGTADLGLPGGSVLQIGQENVRTVRNSSGATITDGTLCMFNGTIGNSGRIKVKPFTGGFNEAMYLYGVATQTFANGDDGIITIEGKVRGLNTTGSNVGEEWNDEDILYAKPGDHGKMTNVVPADNELKLVVATVIHAHATNGCLEIRFTPINENMYYTKAQSDSLLANKVPLNGDFTLDLGDING